MLRQPFRRSTARWIRTLALCGGVLPSKPTNLKLLFNFHVAPNHVPQSPLRSLFETTQTLFWAVFGLIDLDSFELDGIKIFTRFWGMLMFGCYSVINIVVLLNLLIAMMNHSYQLISVSDVQRLPQRSLLTAADLLMQIYSTSILPFRSDRNELISNGSLLDRSFG